MNIKTVQLLSIVPQTILLVLSLVLWFCLSHDKRKVALSMCYPKDIWKCKDERIFYCEKEVPADRENKVVTFLGFTLCVTITLLCAFFLQELFWIEHYGCSIQTTESYCVYFPTEVTFVSFWDYPKVNCSAILEGQVAKWIKEQRRIVCFELGFNLSRASAFLLGLAKVVQFYTVWSGKLFQSARRKWVFHLMFLVLLSIPVVAVLMPFLHGGYVTYFFKYWPYIIASVVIAVNNYLLAFSYGQSQDDENDLNAEHDGTSPLHDGRSPLHEGTSPRNDRTSPLTGGVNIIRTGVQLLMRGRR